MESNNDSLRGVLIYVKPGDIDNIKGGIIINTWYQTIPDSFVHGGWVQVLVSPEYFKELKEHNNKLNLFSNDLKL